MATHDASLFFTIMAAREQYKETAVTPGMCQRLCQLHWKDLTGQTCGQLVAKTRLLTVHLISSARIVKPRAQHAGNTCDSMQSVFGHSEDACNEICICKQNQDKIHSKQLSAALRTIPTAQNSSHTQTLPHPAATWPFVKMAQDQLQMLPGWKRHLLGHLSLQHIQNTGHAAMKCDLRVIPIK